MAKIDFFIAGNGKSGTSFIYYTLKEHPDIFLPNLKENGFFAFEQFQYGFPYYEHTYQAQYSGQKLVGDGNSATSFFPYVPKRIYDMCGKDVKLIFLMRQPMDRAISHYNMAVRQLRETLTFQQAILNEGERYRNEKKFYQGFSYIGRGHYITQIKRFLEYFPLENMLFLIFEKDIISDSKIGLNKICEFLDIDIKPIFREVVISDQQRFGNKKAIIRLVDVREEIKGKAPQNFEISYSENHITFLGRKFLDPSKELIERIKTVEQLSIKKLDPEYEKSLYSIFYKEEVNSLENLLDIELSTWYDRYK